MKCTAFLRGNRTSALALLALSTLSTSVLGQTSTTGAIRGTVTDPQGAVLPTATVTITSRGTDAVRTALTGRDGQYTVGLLPPGEYSVKIGAPGFKTDNPGTITVVVTETARVDAKLTLGSQTETVDVTSASPALQVENATLGTVVDGSTIQELPLTNRNYTQVLTLSAGIAGDVNNAATLGKGTPDVYVNGGSSISNNFHMDGADINNFGSGRAGDFVQQGGIAIPNPDSLQEFKIQTTNYDAGFGRDAGANVDVVTKSGSNSLHGAVWEFFRNDIFNANDTFLKLNALKANPNVTPRRASMKQNQFGATLGGPILKDKFFFFGSYQGTRQINGLSSSSLATNSLFPLTNDRSAAAIGAAACPNGNAKWHPFNGGAYSPTPTTQTEVACNGSNVNPVALKLLQAKIANGTYLIPTPQSIGLDTNGNPIGSSTFSLPSHYSEDQFMVNLDYVLSSKHTLAERYFFSNDPEDQPFSSTADTPGNGVTPTFRNQVGIVKLTSALTPHFLNEGLVSYIRTIGFLQTQANQQASDFGISPSDPSYPLIPIISVTGYFSLGGVNNDVSSSYVNTFEIADQVSWTHGKQSIRAGFTGEKNQFNFNDPENRRGSLGFSTFQDFVLGLSASQNGTAFSNVSSAGAQQGSYYHAYRGTDMAMFLQDDGKLRSNLTVNAGVRWEINSGISFAHGEESSFFPSLVTPFQPIPTGTTTFQGFVVPNNYRLPIPAGITQIGSKSLSKNDLPLHNFGPRVGFAWQPFGSVSKLAVRGGYGIFYTLPNANSVLQTLGNQPFVSSSSLSGTAAAASTFAVPYTVTLTPGTWRPRSNAYTLSVTPVAENIDSPMVQQYNLDIQQELPKNLILEVGYVGTRGTRLSETRALNRAFLASPTNPINGVTTNTVASANIQARVPYQGFTPGGVTRIETYGFSNYNSLQTTLRRQVAHGIYLQGSYTWSKAMTSVANGDGTNGVFAGGSGNSNDPNNRYARWGVAAYDRTNRFVFAYTYQFPSWKNGNAFAKVATGGWKLNGTATFQTGKPLTITDTRNGTAYGTASRAQFVPGMGNGNVLNKTGTVLSRIKTNSFLTTGSTVFQVAPAVPNGTATDYGNSSIGVARGPGNDNWDMAIVKSTRVGGIHESGTVDFRTEFFNVWNHPQYANPATAVSAATYGQITASSAAPRLIQFAVKYVF